MPRRPHIPAVTPELTFIEGNSPSLFFSQFSEITKIPWLLKLIWKVSWSMWLSQLDCCPGLNGGKFNSQSGHIPRLWFSLQRACTWCLFRCVCFLVWTRAIPTVRSQAGHLLEATHQCFSLALVLLSFPSSLPKRNGEKKLIREAF